MRLKTSSTRTRSYVTLARKGKKKSDKKLGQAAVLSGKMWAQWRNHILETSTTWLYYVVITLTRALCACVSKVLKLRGCDFHWSGKTVTIAALKHQPQARLKVCLSCTLEVSTFARVSGTFLLKLKRSVTKTFLNLKLYVSRDPAARNCEKSTAFQVNKMLLNPVHPTFRSLRKNGKSLGQRLPPQQRPPPSSLFGCSGLLAGVALLQAPMVYQKIN